MGERNAFPPGAASSSCDGKRESSTQRQSPPTPRRRRGRGAPIPTRPRSPMGNPCNQNPPPNKTFKTRPHKRAKRRAERIEGGRPARSPGRALRHRPWRRGRRQCDRSRRGDGGARGAAVRGLGAERGGNRLFRVGVSES